MMINTAPFFVGGQLHGLRVPPALWHQPAVGAQLLAGSVIYRRTSWWRPLGQAFDLFVREGMPVNDMVAVVAYMLKDGR